MTFPFGNKLIETGYVNHEQMEQALSESRKSKNPARCYRIADRATTATGFDQALQETAAI